MSDINRVLRLAARPKGMVQDSDFDLREEPRPELTKEGQVLVRNLYLSVDPTQRGWIERDSYLPAVAIGEVMRSFGAGRVVASNDPDFAPGDLVSGMVGWQDHVVLPTKGGGRPTKLPPGVPLTNALSILGLTGLTAYFGLLDIGRPKEGETVVVSGAAGATGMAVGQIAKLKGCRVVGIAGGKDKCDWITGELGFDAAIDYKAEDVAKRLEETCPKRIDIYFDNVGGDILDAALLHLAMRGRVVLCGAISGYNDASALKGPKNYLSLLVQRGRMEGFIILDYFDRVGEAFQELGAWFQAGKLKDRVDVVDGLENAPAALRRLFTGKNTGKQLLKIAEG
ncbi:NADP-dependent oxidoreductase [Chondromyces crocatus]|uniref:NADP-dependent oxidoreductase n=1 Tax=Chondromyces crocatus TaxID=52 RepID=A0A0K1ERX7_CHOCO|nr:NADP-dependent oxidoreductase [Chondromyces crocatus]AKT43675.1 NADP-dependent oxidoreductase [Chondromyces crocatus]